MSFHLKKILLSLVIVAAFSEFTVANAKTLPGTPETVGKMFNAAAREIEVRSKMVLTRCSQNVAAVCNYSVTGNLGVIALSKNGEFNKLEEIILIFGKGSRGADMIVAMGLFLIAYSPGADNAERGKTIISLSKMITSGETKRSVTLDGVTYSISNNGAAGIWFSVSKK